MDRRRRVPTFQELQAVAAPPAPPQAPPNLQPRQPAPAAPVRTAPPTQAERWVAQQRPHLATPTDPAEAVAPAPRVAPPSPTAFAQARPQPAMPQVTPLQPSQGAVVPEGQRTPMRPQPQHAPAAAPVPQQARAQQPVPPQPRAAAPAQQMAPPQPRAAAPQQPAQHVAPPQPRAAAPQSPAHHGAPPQQVATRAAPPVAPRAAPPSPDALAAAREEAFANQPTSDMLSRPTIPQGAPQRPAVVPAELMVTQPGMPSPYVKPPEATRPVTPAHKPAPQDDVVRAEPAALWRRVGAWLFDLTFVGVLVAGFLAIAISVIAPRTLSLTQQLAVLAVPGAALACVLAFVYTTLFAFLWNGRTPGRRALGIHLVDTSGHAPGPLRALTRAGLSLVSFALFLSGFWLALFDRHGQTLHDKLTRTFVVRLQDA